MKKLLAYKRENGRVGIRNHAVVISTVACANTVVNHICRCTTAIPITHSWGCSEFEENSTLTKKTLIGIALNPNVGCVLFVGLGCEQIHSKDMAQQIKDKPVDYIDIQACGGTNKAIQVGLSKLSYILSKASSITKQEINSKNLVIGVKCGGSDWTNGVVGNPVLGKVSDLIIAHGGTVVMTETIGFLGSEHLLAKQASSPEIASQIINILKNCRKDFQQRFGQDIYEINPTPGNKEGGITTLAEKSIGNIRKGGTTSIRGVLDFGEQVSIHRNGLWISKSQSTGPDTLCISGLNTAGCQLILFATGRGTPLGSPITPVIKLTGNPTTFSLMKDNFDIDISSIINGKASIEDIAEKVKELLYSVINGKLTKSEILGHIEFSIPRW